MNRFTFNSFKKSKMSGLLGVFAFMVFFFSSTLTKAQSSTNCGDLVALTTSNFPGTSVESGITGVCLLCGVTNQGNVINSNTDDAANMALNISVGGAGYVQVNSPVIFPAGSEAGFTFNPQAGFIGVIGLDILGKITVTTYLNGQEQESQTGSNLINGDIIEFFNNKQSIGFTTNLPFNKIRITIATGLGLLSNPQVYHAYVRTGCFNFQSCPSVATTSTGSFVANGTAGQTGTISIPISNATAGAVNVTVANGGFSVNPNPRTINVTSGQTALLVPVIFNGSGTPGARSVEISVTTSSGTKTCTVTVTVTPESVLALTNEAMNLNLGNQNEYTGNAYTEGIPTGGVEVAGNSGKYNYYAVNCVTGTSTAGTSTSTTTVLTSIAGVNPVTGASYATNLYPNVNGTVVLNRTTGAYTYTKDNAYTGTTAKFCVKVCDLNEISPCKQIEYNLTNVGTVAPPAAPSITANPNPPIAGEAAVFTATGCSGTVTWFNNGTQVGTGATFNTTVPVSPVANYTATCTVSGVASTPSNTITSQPGTVNPPSVSSNPNPPVAGQSVTLTASGCAGTVTWFNNGSQVGTGTTFTATAVAGGNYTATCTVNGVISNPSSPIAVSQPAIADLAVAFTTNPGSSFASGQSRQYVVTVRNLSTSTTTSATTLSISSIVSGFSVTGGGTQNIGALAPGGQQTFSITLLANSKGASGSLGALIPASADNNAGNNAASVSVSIQNP
jgi:hypothetical protein